MSIKTELHYRLWKPIFNGSDDANMVLTRNQEKRVKFLTEMLIKIREQGEAEEILFAAGGDDGDLDEFADALLMSGVNLSDDVVKRVRVTNTPIGPAPEDIRSAWKGVEFIGIKLPAIKNAEVDFVSGEPIPEREAYAVYAPYAIAHLRENSPEAANWFAQNLPHNIPMLSFGANEVTVVTPKQ